MNYLSPSFLLRLTFLFIIMAGILTKKTSAAQFDVKENGVLNKPVYDDFYLVGGDVTIDAPIHGDLIMAGGDVRLKDTVYGDLMITGGVIEIEGPVMEDIRAVGGDISLSGKVGSDMTIIGGTVAIRKGVVIQNDLTVSGGDLTLGGKVKGMVRSYAGKTEFLGTVLDTFLVKGGKIIINGLVKGPSIITAGELELGNNAEFQEDIYYWTKGEKIDFSAYQKNGTAQFKADLAFQESDFEWAYLGMGITLFWFFYILSMGLILILIIWLFNSYFEKTATTIRDQFGKSLGYGVLYLIGVPVLVIVLMVTLIGLPLGFFIGTLYGFSIMLANAFLAVTISNLLDKVYGLQWGMGLQFLVALLALVILKLIGWIPFVGWLIIFLAMCLFFGGFWVATVPSRNP